jgi:MFS family permease
VAAFAAGAADSYPPLRTSGRALALFIICYLLYFVDVQAITLLVAPIKQTFAIDDTRYSLLVGGPSLIAIFVVGLPMAQLVDRSNRRNLLICAIILWTAMNIASAFATSFWMLFALKIGVAMGGAWFYPTVVSLLSDFFPPQRRTMAFTVLQLCATGAVGVAVALGGATIGLAQKLALAPLPWGGHLDWWRWVFILVSVPAPVGALLLLSLDEPQRRETASASGVTPKIAPYVRAHWGALLAIALGVAIPNVVLYAARSWLPEFFIRTFAMTASQAGSRAGFAMLVAAVIGTAGGGLLAHTLRARGMVTGTLAVVIGSYATPVILFAIFPLMPDAASAATLFIMGFLLFSLHGGPQIDLIQAALPNELRGRFITFVLAVSASGVFLGPFAVGALNDHLFPTGSGIRYSLLLVLSLFSALAALCWCAGARPILALQRARDREADSR